MQIFKRSSNTLAKLTVTMILVGFIFIFVLCEFWTRSTYASDLDVNVTQPVPFSHQHHVKGLGLDCRYCHGSVENSAFAGMPSTQTCMSCHSQIWPKASALKPVRESYAQNIPLQWNRVYVLDDFVYFNHSIHVQKGVSCITCHGHVEEMPLIHKARAFYMRECLECHRHPEEFLPAQAEAFKSPINSHSITNCSACHR